MEAGFINQHDEYFSSDIYDQSNGFESENSIFNGLMGDFVLEATKANWNYGENARCTKDKKEDFQKSFQDWENHINSLQSKEEDITLKAIDSGIELLYESVSENLPDIFGTDLKSLSGNHENQSPKPFNLGNVFSQEVNDQSNQFQTIQTSDKLGPDNYEIVEITIEEDNLINKTIPHFDQSTKADPDQNVETKQLDLPSETVSLERKEKKDNKKSTDLLPKEVIDRIKAASKRRKCISLIPAVQMDPESKRQNTRHIKTATLDRPKSDISIHLDHDYCSGHKKTTCQKISPKDTQSVESWEKNSKKDSGLESGDVSDASETTQEKRVIFKQVKPGESLLRINHYKIKQDEDFANKAIGCEVPKVEIKSEKQEDSTFDLKDHEVVVLKEEKVDIQESIVKQETKKKKLNLEEYRSRRKNITTPNTNQMPEIKKENNESSSARVMVNVEVQTQADREDDVTKDRNCQRQRYRRRSTSSSSSSVASKSRRHRRKSRRRRYNRGSRQRSSWSTSRSRSRSSSTSVSSHSRSRSSKRHKRSRSRSDYRRSSQNRSRYSSERSYRKHDDWSPVEKQKQIEERRVIYVGQIAEGTTKAQLRERFQKFGPIVDISLHFRERGDNYGFVTFMFKIDAYDAVEHGNDDPFEQRYDICFGGRRAFCKQRYADLDSLPQTYTSPYQNSRSCDSFDTLLREAQETLRKKQKIV